VVCCLEGLRYVLLRLKCKVFNGLQVPSPPPVVIVISGPSGVGKDAVIKALQASRPDLHFVVTATSRYPLLEKRLTKVRRPRTESSKSERNQECPLASSWLKYRGIAVHVVLCNLLQLYACKKRTNGEF
jgi:hypothetical protein